MLLLAVYKMTATFPANEMYGLVSQLRRAILSVASNIVEGFHRQTVRDSLHFYNIANASLEEARYQFIVARDLGYVDETRYTEIEQQASETSRMLYGWITSQRNNSISPA